MKCPKCGECEQLAILVTAWAAVTSQDDNGEPDGTELMPDDQSAIPDFDQEWDLDSPAECMACKYRGVYEEFKEGSES